MQHTSHKDSGSGASVIAGAVMIQLALGAIYAWPAFARPLQEAGWSTAQTQWPFTVGLATFAIVMLLAGRQLHTLGPRKLTMASATLLGAGYLIAGLSGGESFWPVLIGIGFLGGAGIGLGYVVPIAVGMQWFPDKKGLITGVAVAGFGLGAVIWVKLAGTWGGLIADWGLGRTFVIYAAVFFAVVMTGSLWMRFPPSAKSSATEQKPTRFDFRSAEMIRTRHYWSIFLTFAFSTAAGLMCIGLMKQFPVQALHEGGMPLAAADAAAGVAVVVFAIFNAIGRIGWGRISDRIGHAVNCDHRGRRTALIAMAASQAVCVALFPFFAGTEQSLYLLAALIGFNFGGNFALFPAITSDTFGQRFFGHNYGLVFIAYGIGGGAMGPMLGGYLGDLGHFTLAFLIAAAMSLVAAVVVSSVRIPTKQDRPVSTHAAALPGAAATR